MKREKRNHMLILLIILLVLSVSFLLFYVNSSRYPEENVLEETCSLSGGTVNNFSNACANYCYYERGEVDFCAQVITESCDCGQGRCWNGNYCEDI